MVVIDEFSLTKTEFTCTDAVTATITVENTGSLKTRKMFQLHLEANQWALRWNQRTSG